MAKIENSKTAQDGVPMSDVKPTLVPPGYQKQIHRGEADASGDQTKLATPAPKGGVTPQKQA